VQKGKKIIFPKNLTGKSGMVTAYCIFSSITDYKKGGVK